MKTIFSLMTTSYLIFTAFQSLAESVPGSLLWATRAGGTATDAAFGIASLDDESILVTGNFDGTVTFGLGETNETTLVSLGSGEIFVAKYAPDATLVWARRDGGSGDDEGAAIATYDDGSALIGGKFSGNATFGSGESNETTLVSAGGTDICIAKYNSDGTLAWVKRGGGTAIDEGADVSALTDGGALITGYFRGSATFGPGEVNQTIISGTNENGFFVARYNADGTLAWAKQAVGSGSNAGRGIVGLSDGSALVTGSFSSTATFGSGETNETILTSAGSNDVFLALYNPDGILGWVKAAEGGASDSGLDIAALPDGTAFVIGDIGSSTTFGPGEVNETVLSSLGSNSVFIARFEPDGTLAWAKRAAGGGDDDGLGIVLLSDDGPLVTGVFSGTAIFGASEAQETSLTSQGSRDIFIARYEPDGTLVWATSAGGVGVDIAYSIAALPDDTGVLTGFFSSTATFGSGESEETILTSVGSEDIFLARYSTASSCFYQSLFVEEWPLIAADLGLQDNNVHSPGDTIPERWAVAMVWTVLCNFDHPHRDATFAAYIANIAALENEQASIATQVDPYKHILAALLLVNQNRQNHFKTLLGLEGVYEVVHSPARLISDEVFSDDGDLDGDGVSNVEEYDNVIESGGSIDDFAEATSDPNLKGILMPVLGVLGLVVLAAMLPAMMMIMMNRGKREKQK